MHDGSLATLDDVIEFYDGGDNVTLASTPKFVLSTLPPARNRTCTGEVTPGEGIVDHHYRRLPAAYLSHPVW
jgi:hypothetical protein